MLPASTLEKHPNLERRPAGGVGMAYRPMIHKPIMHWAKLIDFLEVPAEDYVSDDRRQGADADESLLAEACQRFPVIGHGNYMSVGSAQAPKKDYFDSVVDLCRRAPFFEYTDHLAWTVTYVPGAQPPTYFLPLQGNAQLYPSQQKLSDGRLLKDVPAEQWATLPEIAEKPLSFGPFMITEWVKGQNMTLAANPHYAGGTGVKKIVVQFISDTNQAVAQLLSGDVDYLEKTTLGAGSEVQTVMDAVKTGKVNAKIIPSPSWEHIDMNMFTQ